jgi:hypothetical protein
MFAPYGVPADVVAARCDARHASFAATKINVNALVLRDGKASGEVTDEPVERGGFPQMRTWQEPTVRSPGGGPEYGDMILALRDFLDDVAAAAPDTATTVALAHDLRDWSDRLAPAAVPERKRIFARRLDLPGRGQTMSPNFIPVTGNHESVRGKVTFGQYFLGGGGAVHGGAIPLLFDEVLGRLASSGDRAPRELPTCTPISGPSPPSARISRCGPGSSASRGANDCCERRSLMATLCVQKPRDCSSSCAPTNREPTD